MAEAGTITCGLTIEYLNQQQSVTRTAKWRTSTLTLVRNEFREIYLDVRASDSSLRFLLQNISVHKKFVSEGKATIHFQLHPAKVYISNAPASQLLVFLKTLFVKMSSFKCSPKVPLREQLLTSKGRNVEEISPINAKDVTRVKTTVGTQVDVKRASKQKSKHSTSNVQAAKKRCVESLLTEKLTDEQQRVVDAVMRGKNIFFTGSAGTGKSFLLRHIIGALVPDKTVATASTGAAACLINGTTLHSFAGIGDGESSLDRSVQLAQRPQVLSNWKRCKHLIIDEISMVDGKYFEKVEKVARIIKGVDKPFGGIQLIVCGDFLQLPPVVRDSQRPKFCFQYPVWKQCEFQVYNLAKVHRQNDTKFIDILNNIRLGRVTEEMTQELLRTASQTITKDNIVATKLCSHNQEATSINNAELNRLPGEERRFEAEDSCATARKLLDDQTPVEAVLVLKVGAQVMLLKNISVARGLVNGARGVITKFSKDGLPVVRFMSGLECTVPRDKWVAKSASGTHYARKQIPLKLAWAFSIHKSQGLTLDCVEISLSKVFEAGQAYVALSRAKSLESLRIINFDPKQVWADKDVLNFYHREGQRAKLLSNHFIPLGPKRK
ncbi:ATP-dependent DNA helicase PIF1-like [Macrosteles quadrilineatus]|uniref:ATP-dependent DNA helicase PIF1-like n=1 Tax=Macrosteles quadrilineatus TaxID=74068 RepID=UPI0023E2F16A|nr:ATP-dependent DNA helicase PIF1-like [Macrosteles quadrilineatus]